MEAEQHVNVCVQADRLSIGCLGMKHPLLGEAEIFGVKAEVFGEKLPPSKYNPNMYIT